MFDKLDKLREKVGPITLTSGYRTPKFNAQEGGSINSNHVKGLAVDCRFNFKGWSHLEIRSLLVDIGFNNAGFYYYGKKLDRIHLDLGKCWGNKGGWSMLTDNYCEKTYRR